MTGPPSTPPRAAAAHDDETLLRAMQAGDEQVFRDLVHRWSGVMIRLARSHVARHALAEEVVQDAWLTVLRSLDRFERRSSLRTWVLGIVVNLARSRARAERRSAPRPMDIDIDVDVDGPVVAAARFLPADHARWPHHWAVAPAPWPTPEADLLAAETRAVIGRAIDELPAALREVLVLRDVEGLSAAETCNILGLTDTHQRVRLHRARSRVRAVLELYLTAKEAP